MEMNWPVLMFCKSEDTICTISRDQTWNKKGLASENDDILFIDSSGNKFQCRKIEKNKLSLKSWVDILFLNPSYTVSYTVSFVENMDFDTFKEFVIKKVSESSFFDTVSESLVKSVLTSHNYKDILELFY